MSLLKPISISISRSICISLLLIFAITGMGQKRKIAIPQPKDTTRLFRHVSVSVDLAGPLLLKFSDYGQYEVAARVNLRDKYFPVIELGYGQADSEDINTKLHYTSKAPYGRLGMDFNILKNKHDDYRLYAGFRYGYTNFKYSVSHPGLTDPVWGTTIPYALNDIPWQAHWLEGVFGVEAKIWGPFHLGWSIRYKRMLTQTKNPSGDAWYISGYGRNGGTRLGGTFNVIIEI